MLEGDIGGIISVVGCDEQDWYELGIISEV